MLAAYLGLTISALFTGAAFYISFAEQPARLGLDDQALLAQWKPSYKRGFAIQAPLAIIGFVLGIVAWRMTGKLEFVIGGTLLLANWPWTLFGMMPINKTLMAIEPQEAGPQSRALLVKWIRLHSGPDIIGISRDAGFPDRPPVKLTDQRQANSGDPPRRHTEAG